MVQGPGMVQGPSEPWKEHAAAVGTVASCLCPPCLHPWPTGPHPARLCWCMGGGGRGSAAGAALLGGRSPSPSRGQGWSSGWGRRARVAPLPQFPQPLSTRADAVTAVSGARPGCVPVGTSVEDTRWQQWAVRAERSRTAVHGCVSLWPGPRGHLDHGHGSHLDHSHASIPWPCPHRGLGHPPRSQWGCSQGGAMGAAGEWDPHPCTLEGMRGTVPQGFLWGFKQPAGVGGMQDGEGRRCSGVLAHPLPLGPGLEGTWGVLHCQGWVGEAPPPRAHWAPWDLAGCRHGPLV